MMTNPTTHESARQILGKALRFFREQRSLSQRELANRVGCAPGDIDDWERGRSAPPDHRWGRLCKMLHDDLAAMRATWQRARAEEEREKTPSARLTSKPFANLEKKLVAPPPVLFIVPPAAPMPSTLHDDGFDLRPAYKAMNKLPQGWRTASAIADRKAFAIELIKRGMTSDDIYKEVRRRFGVGIGAPVLTELRTEVREAKAREYQAATASQKQELPNVPTPPPAPVAPPAPPKPPVAVAPENDIEGAVRLILEAIPHLKSFRIEVSENGDVSVDHTIREVKVVETSGSMKMRKP